MDRMQKPKVPITDEDKLKSYYKYYERDTTPIDSAKMSKIFGPPMSPAGKLTFPERAKILEPGFTDETGYCVMPDGTGYISDTTFIPGGTAEMVDWYFAWRGLDPFRFTIVDPTLNLGASTMQTSIVKDPFRTIQEKYWDTTQEIRRSERGPKEPPKIDFLNFQCPERVGFDLEKIGPDKETKTLVCARNFADGQPPMAAPDYFVCHQVKEAGGGINVTSRIWFGWSVRFGKNVKALPDEFAIPARVVMGLMIQNASEWANLSAILPALYAEEKENL